MGTYYDWILLLLYPIFLFTSSEFSYETADTEFLAIIKLVSDFCSQSSNQTFHLHMLRFGPHVYESRTRYISWVSWNLLCLCS